MIILALETSTRQASLAVWRDGEVVREWSFCSERSHNSLLFAPLREAWAVAEPDLMVVGTGPGSYAGVRVALAAHVYCRERICRCSRIARPILS